MELITTDGQPISEAGGTPTVATSVNSPQERPAPPLTPPGSIFIILQNSNISLTPPDSAFIIYLLFSYISNST